ncbi:MAG: glycerate kinase [Promethearchaeota archaeon]
MHIKNISQLFPDNLSKNQKSLRKTALQALDNSIYAVKPQIMMERILKLRKTKLILKDDEFDLTKYKKIYIIGGGKATAEMTFSLEKNLVAYQDIDYEGIINIPKNASEFKSFENSKIIINFASHPIPDEQGLEGTKAMMELIERSTENDLIFCLISGGGSALLPLPKRTITLKDLQKVNSLLLSSGASIHEINTIRKHLSDFKGGNLAKKIYNSSGATLISLIISDVVGDNLDSIASGPTVPDETTFKDALEIIEKYDLEKQMPKSVIELLKMGKLDKNLENPKLDDICFSKVYNYLIGSVASAVQEANSFLKERGFKILYFSNNIVGEAREFGRSLNKIISQYVESHLKQKKIDKLGLIGTGELTVTIKGKGIGGRNQEMLLAFIDTVKDLKTNYDFLIIGANLDGIEGNSKAMGALVDNYVIKQTISKKIDCKKFLEVNDSNKVFKELSVELITGPTGCNVNDLIIILISN